MNEPNMLEKEMRLNRDEYQFALARFGTAVADKLMHVHEPDKVKFIIHRLNIVRQADELRDEGFSVDTNVAADTSQTVFKVCTVHSDHQQVRAGSDAYVVVNEALHLRDGFMSDYVPLTLEDVLLATLPKPFVLK